MISTRTRHRVAAARTRRCPAWLAILLIAGSAFAAPAGAARAAAQPAPVSQAIPAAARPVVAVADFYALVTLPILITDPERFAADDLSAMLLRAGGQTLTVLPRSEVRRAEGALGWRTYDALKFARLGALAQSLHADRLVVGWISQLSLDSGGAFSHLGPSGYTAMTAVNVQVFEAAPGRLIAEHKTYGQWMGIGADFVLQQALDDALAQAVRPTLSVLSVPVPRAVPGAP